MTAATGCTTLTSVIQTALNCNNGVMTVDEAVRKGFQVIRGTVTLTTNADAATVEKLKGAVDAHCPMCATISDKIPIALTVVKA